MSDQLGNRPVQRRWVGRLILGGCVVAVALVVIAGGLKNRTESCWMRGVVDAGAEYGAADLRIRFWPPGTDCIGPDGAKLD